MKRNLLIALSIILMLFAFTACSNDNSSGLDDAEAADIAKQINPVELLNDALVPGKVKGATVTFREAKAAATFIATVEFDNAEYNGVTIASGRLSYTLTGEYTGTSFKATTYSITTEAGLSIRSGKTTTSMEISVPKTTATNAVFSATMTVNADGSVSADKIQVSITLSSGSSVTVGGNDVTDKVPSAPSVDTPDEPVVENDWPISVRVGTNTGHENNDKLSSAAYSNGTITVTSTLSALDSYVSSNEGQPGASKWIALLISVDGVDIKTVSYEDNPPVDDAAIAEANAVGGNGKEFVLWIRAEQVLTTPKTFKLSRDGVDPITVTVNVVDDSAAPADLAKATLGEWVTDRTAPANWSDEGQIHIESDPQKTTAEFSRYQGMKATTDVPLTDYWKVSATYIVDDSLKNVNNGQVSIWANTKDSTDTVDWTIVGISTDGGVVSWDSDGDGAWNDTDESIAPITDGDEVDIVMEFNKGLIKQYINDVCVKAYDVGAEQTQPYEVFIQIINNDQANSYSADWTIPVVEYKASV